MTPQSAVPETPGSLFRETTATIARNPLVIFLFIFLALIQASALTVVFLSHSEPFSSLLGPIIRRFWGDRFLHYPDNFLLLPKLFSYAEMAVITVVGLIVTGITIQLVASARDRAHSSTIVTAFWGTLKRYFGMLFVWLCIFFALRYGARAALDHLPNSLPVHFAGLLGVFLLTQMLTAFLFPAILLSGKKYWKSIVEGLMLALKNIPGLFLLLLLPVGLSVALSYLKTMSPLLSQNNPDMVLVILYCSIVVATVVDLFITSATAILYLKVRNSK